MTQLADLSIANAAKSKEATSLVIELSSPNNEKHNERNNYSEWVPWMQTIMGMQYGAMIGIFRDQVPYVIPELGPEDLL